MLERNCPICKSTEKKKIDEIHLVNFDGTESIFDHQMIMSCDNCGFVYHEGIDMEKMETYYSSYTGGSQIQSMTADEKILNNNMADFIEYHLKMPKSARILDIGCGYGWVIEILRERGYISVVGMDTDEPLMEKLREKGLSVEIGSIYSKDRNDLNGSYDVIILKMVMEHLENPREAVENIKKWLKPNGILVIEVPDCSLYDKTAFFTGYFQSVNMEHINNYSPISLMNLMNKWRMVVCESTESEGIFPVLRMAFTSDNGWEKEIVYDKTDEKIIQKSLKIPSEKGKRINERIECLKEKKCAVWGVSAFTRGLLTYTELKKMNIEFFIDRNQELQKKTLLGKKIVAPEKIKDFDGVLVIPGKGSQQAIMKNIRDLNLTNDVVCLSD